MPAEKATQTAVLLFDGVFLQCPELRPHWDVAIWVDASFEVTVGRAIRRDAANDTEAEVLRGLYQRRYVPGQLIYMERCQPGSWRISWWTTAILPIQNWRFAAAEAVRHSGALTGKQSSRGER